MKDTTKKMLLTLLTLLSLFVLILTACDSDGQEQNQYNPIPDTSTDIVDVGISPDMSEIRYQVEPLDFLPYNAFSSHNIGSIFMYNDLVYIPRIGERMKFSEEFVGEDFEWWSKCFRLGRSSIIFNGALCRRCCTNYTKPCCNLPFRTELNEYKSPHLGGFIL
ncbi:MAG: hypothetical protein FWD05_12885 [Oscillospiraceae bacterium]|nr:hypothetical protein [Oscillospiraceae bacterium]